MLAVIFKAKIKKLDREFFKTAERLRKLAFEEYGCLGMESETNDGIEITISYWPSVEHIKRWKQNSEHLKAQQQASKWYESYEVRIEERNVSYPSLLVKNKKSLKISQKHKGKCEV